MPPRHTYWTILIDNAPTAFRSATREELQPTFERLRRRHPSAVMRWFARGRVWASPDEAEQAARAARERRAPSWRPGGSHRDPREAARQQRKARNADRRAERFERRQAREQSRGAGTDRKPPPRSPQPRADTGRPRDRAPYPSERSRTGTAHPSGPKGPRLDAARNKNKPPAAARSRQAPLRRPQPRPHQVPRPAREKPPKPPFGPDRPPRPGQEPTPEPVRPDEIVMPHDPPERGTAGPDGSRLIKRRKS